MTKCVPSQICVVCVIRQASLYIKVREDGQIREGKQWPACMHTDTLWTQRGRQLDGPWQPGQGDLSMSPSYESVQPLCLPYRLNTQSLIIKFVIRSWPINLAPPPPCWIHASWHEHLQLQRPLLKSHSNEIPLTPFSCSGLLLLSFCSPSSDSPYVRDIWYMFPCSVSLIIMNLLV